MKSLAIVGLAGVLALSGCATLDQAIGDKQAEFANICRNAPVIHAAFVVAASGGSISQNVINREAQAYAIVEKTCANPPKDSAQALIAVAEAYATILGQRAVVAEKTGE